METRRRGAGTEHCPQPGSPELGQLGPSPQRCVVQWATTTPDQGRHEDLQCR